MTQRDIYWRQGETLDITVPTELDLTGADLVLRVRRRLSDEDLMLDIDSDGPPEARITAVEGGYRVQLGAAEGSLIQTVGRDARWVYAAKAINSADPEIAAWMDYGDWVVKADPARAGEQVAPTPAGDLRYLQPAQIVAGTNVTITTSGTGAGLTLTFSATGGGGGSVAWADVAGKPSFAAVATSGAYSDLTGRPTLGTAAALNVGTGAGTVAAGNDARLSDARTPTAHTHPLSELQQSGASAGQVVQWSGSAWVPATPSAAPNSVWIGAGELIPRVTNGAGIDGQEFGTNRQNLDYLAFDPGTAEFAQASFAWPGTATTATARVYWTAASGSGAAVWRVALRCYADDDAIDQAFGTAQSVTDTLLAAGDAHESAVTAAITPAGTPANRRLTLVQIDRNAADGSDTLAVDARLIGILLEFS